MEHTQQTAPITQVSPVTPLSVIWYALGGCAVGMILGMLFAPKSGRETREDIADWGRVGREKSRALFERFRTSKVGQTAQEALEKGSEAMRT